MSSLPLRFLAAATLAAGVAAATSGATMAPAQAGAAAVPAAIVKLAERSQCRVAQARLPEGGAAWVSDSRAGSAHVAWCSRQYRGDTVFDLLVAVDSPRHPWARCAPHVQLALEEPFPYLRTVMLPDDLPYPMRLSDFAYFTGASYWLVEPTKVESPGIPAGLAVEFGVGDAGQILLCHGDKWIVAGYH